MIYYNNPQMVRKLSRDTIRRPTARVQIEWSGTYTDLNLSALSYDNNRVSYVNQIYDGATKVKHKWFCLAPDGAYSKLDGNFHPMPNDDSNLNWQVGWRSAIIGGNIGEYELGNPIPTVEVSFAEREFTGVKVVGDTALEEYPLDFQISLYDADYQQLATWQINSLTAPDIATLHAAACQWDISVGSVMGVSKMVLRVWCWSRPYTFPKIVEIYSEVENYYDTSNIVSLSILEETDSSLGTVPVGNISCNELDLSLQNIDNKLFPFNEASELHTHIIPGRKIIPYIGFIDASGDEYLIPKGVYWSGDWSVGEQDAQASTSALDRMAKLQEIQYGGFFIDDGVSADGYKDLDVGREDAEYTYWLNRDSRYIYQQLLGYLQTNIMLDLEFDIDPTLENIIIPVTFFGQQSYFDIFKSLAQVSLAYVYMDTITEAEIIEAEMRGNVGVKDILRVVGLPTAIGDRRGTAETVISARDYLTRIHPTRSNELANMVNVQQHAYEISLEGRPEEIEGGTVIVNGINNASIDKYGRATLEYPDSHLIQTKDVANDIILSVLNIFSDTHKVQTLKTFGDPSLSILDVVEIPEFQKFHPRENNIEVLRSGIYAVGKIQTEYDGSLRQNIECRRIGDVAKDLPIIIIFMYSPVPVYSDDDNVVLTWDTELAETVKLLDKYGDIFAADLELSGSLTIPINTIDDFGHGYIFTLVATNGAGDATATVEIMYGVTVTMLGSINTSPTTVYSTTGSGTVVVRWTTIDVQMVELNGEAVALSGEQTFTISQTTTFTLYGYSGWNGAYYTQRGTLSAVTQFVAQPLPNYVVSNVISETEKYLSVSPMFPIVGSIGARRPPPIIPTPPNGVKSETGILSAAIIAILTGSIGARRPAPIIPVPPNGVIVEDGEFSAEIDNVLVGSIGDRRAGHVATDVISESGHISAYIDTVLVGSVGPRYQ